MLPRRPITECSAEEVNRRVAYHLIRKHYSLHLGGMLRYPPLFVHELALHYGAAGFVYLRWVLEWYARNLAQGFTTRELRDLGPEQTTRALHKRRPARPTR